MKQPLWTRVILGALVAWGSGGAPVIAREPKPAKIVYIRESIPHIPVKPYYGQRYDDRVPDTFDIAERAEIGIRGLTGPTNALADHELYFGVRFNRNPVTMYHDWSYWCQPKFMEALPLLRMITGSAHENRVDGVWRQVALQTIGPDGLCYIPLEGRPWSREAPAFVSGVVRADGSFTNINDTTVKQVTHPFFCARMLGALTVHYLREDDPIWKQTIERMIDRLLELAVHQDDFCYFPMLVYEPHARLDADHAKAAMHTGMAGAETNSRLIRPLARYYRLTGYAPARELAEKISRYMRFQSQCFTPDGAFLANHFHAHTACLLGMLHLATATDDQELLEFVRKSYDWAQSPHANSSSLVGFFPEYLKKNNSTSESCEVAEMIAMALKFSQENAGDYYDDADRWIRNQYAESQMTQCEWLFDHAATLPESEVGYNATAYRTPQRAIGAFAGWASANDWWIPSSGIGIMHCCTGNASRVLYLIWQQILEWEDGSLRINLLLNRASPWADVRSSIPYLGRVDIKLKQDCKRLTLHAPEWIETGSDEVAVTVDGKPTPFRWQGRYIEVDPLQAGSEVAFTFPIAERTVKETIGGKQYTLVVKGNTVVSIDPPGERNPFYRRDHYRSNQVKWRQVERFLADEPVSY